MAMPKTLVDELEDSIAYKDIGKRADVLKRVTDLFVVNSEQLPDEHLALFDEVMVKLVAEVDIAARAAFGERVAEMDLAPAGLLRQLACDDAIEVAGPVLRRCGAIPDEILVDSARTKGQDHLLAISERSSLSERVTDVLVERGDGRVALSVAGNLGARFSETGFSTLVSRTETDDELAVRLWSRPDVPRASLIQLFEVASESVRRELEARNRDRAVEIREVVLRARAKLEAEARRSSRAYQTALAHIRSLRESGELSAGKLASFAAARRIDETALTLSYLCDLSIEVVERAMQHEKPDQVLVLTRSVDIRWETVRAILSMPGGCLCHAAEEDCATARASFEKLQVPTAKRALAYYRLREQATQTSSRVWLE
jgi:uncharacterized protein (DUF2336 family)